MDFIVNVQGFKRPYNDFVFKELAIVPLQQDPQPLVFLFDRPCQWNSLPASYKSQHNYHAIAWTAGDIPYEELRCILQETLSDVRTIYVKGMGKKAGLKSLSLMYKTPKNLAAPY